MGVAAILLASGYGRRYGSNKLLDTWEGVPLYRRALKALPLDRLDTIAEPAGSPLFVYCRSGARSAQAKARLARAGYSVTDLGGLLGYRGPLEA